jgi:hypothetical protein
MRSSTTHSGSAGLGGLIGRFLSALAAVVFVDPFALIVAAAGGWLTVLSAMSLGRAVAAGTHLGGVLGCTAYVAVLSLVTILALAHVLITGLAGWGAAIRADSARGASADRPGQGLDS